MILPWYISTMTPKLGVKYTDYVALRLEPEMRKRLQDLAEAEERSIGAIARIILREGLEAREAKGSRKKRKKPSQEG
jgi:hypothetical protein